jgi:hypothetical protein
MPKQSTFPFSSAQASDVLVALRGYTGPNTGSDMLVPAGSVAGLLNGTSGNILFYGAVSGSDAAAAITQAAAANNLVIIPAGTWPIGTTPTIPADVIIETLPGAVLTGSGATALGFSSGAIAQTIEVTSTAADTAMQYFGRNAAYTGGTAGFTSAAVMIKTTVASGVLNDEWPLVSILNNSAAAGENVAAYLQGNKFGNIGPTWGAVIEVTEQSAVNNPTHGTVGLEVDVSVNGTDNSGAGNRVGIDVVVRKFNAAGVGGQANWGVRVDSSQAGALVGFGFGFVPGSAINIGFDASQATTVNIAAFQMATSQAFILDGPTAQLNKIYFDGVRFRYQYNGALTWGISTTGNMNVGAGTNTASSIFTNNTQLLGTGQFGIMVEDTLSGTTSSGALYLAQSIAAATTVGNYYGISINNPTLGSSATITTLEGIRVGDLTSFTTNAYGLVMGVSSGSGKFNLYANGTAPSYFAGNVGIGVAPNTNALAVTGAVNLNGAVTVAGSNNLTVGGELGVNGVAPAAQPTGYGTPTGGSHQSSFAAGSITLANLAAAVAQLIIDLKGYGFLGA